MIKIDPQTALVIVDVQNDFCPGGALAVPAGDEVVPILNEYIARFQQAGAPIVATRDWHPDNHTSFQPQGGIWPAHCVAGTEGAAFHADLALPAGATVVSKATTAAAEAYSGFGGTGLAEMLRERGVRRLLIGGLATDYCVKATVLDALAAGFESYYLQDAMRGVEVTPGDSARAEAEMRTAGALPLTLDGVVA